MAFTEADRVQIRKYLGYADIWLQADPRLESAITNVQSLSDGGTRPNPSPSAVEVDIKATIVLLQAIDTQIDGLLQSTSGAIEVDEIKLDIAREMSRLSMRGRVHVHRLARAFDTMPRSDIWGPAPQIDQFFPASPFGGRSGY